LLLIFVIIIWAFWSDEKVAKKIETVKPKIEISEKVEKIDKIELMENLKNESEIETLRLTYEGQKKWN
jgi:hypothetical protein